MNTTRIFHHNSNSGSAELLALSSGQSPHSLSNITHDIIANIQPIKCQIKAHALYHYRSHEKESHLLELCLGDLFGV